MKRGAKDWTTNINGFTISGDSMTPKKKLKVKGEELKFDSSKIFSYMPKHQWQELETAIRANLNTKCKWITDKEYNTKLLECACSASSLKSEYPTLEMNIGVNKQRHSFKLEPSQYLLYQKNNSPRYYLYDRD